MQKAKLTREVIEEMLTDPSTHGTKAVGRALVALLARQTIDEKASKEARHHNSRGFTPADAYMGTSCADFFKKTGFLTPKQLEFWRTPNKKGVAKICKYANQLLDISKEKAGTQNTTGEKTAVQSNQMKLL